jgi:hypothetical protein
MTVGEWDQRQLCPDGGCVGVIGPDGTCKVCGRAAQNWGDERKRGLIDPPDEDEDEDDDDDDSDDDLDDELAAGEDDGDIDDDVDGDGDDGDGDEPDRASAASPGDWSARRLCGDGTCIGLLGLDGRCKVCGRTPAEAAGLAPALTHGASTATAAEAGPSSERADGDAAPAAQDPDARARARCPDAGCNGAIGPDGHCDVCGKVAA